MNLPEKYVMTGSTISTIVVLREDEDYVYFVPPKTIQKIKKEKVISEKNDAQYRLFVKRRQSGTPLKNFQKSKYYKMYTERAQKENPELIF